MIRELFKDSLIYGASAILSRGLSIITLPIYARILAPADYGVLDMVMVVGTLANLIVALEINQALLRFINDADSGKRRVMASTALWFTIGAYSLVLFLALPASPWLCRQLLSDLRYLGDFQISLFAIGVNGIFYLLQGQLRFELRSRDYAAASIIYALTTLVLGITLGKLLGLKGIIASQLAAALLASAFSMSRLSGRYGLLFSVKQLRSMLRFSMPLVPSGLATFLTLHANRIMLNSLAGLGSVGLFGIGARIAGATSLLIVGLQTALTPLIYTHYRDPQTPRQLATITHGFVAVSFTCCLFLGLYAPEILSALVPPAYRDASRLVLMLSVGTLFGQMYIFFPGIAIAKRTTLQLAIFGITGVVALVANWFLIQAYGAPGAAAATLLSSSVFIVLWIIISQRLYPLPLRIGSLAVVYGLLLCAGAGGAILQADLGPGPMLGLLKALLLILFAAGIVLSGLISTKEITVFWQSIGRRLHRN